MATLARLRPRLTPRLAPLLRAASLQTAADSTQLHESSSVPDEGHKPFTVKLHDDSFRGYKTEPPSLEVEVTKDGLLKMYKEMTTMRRMEQAADAAADEAALAALETALAGIDDRLNDVAEATADAACRVVSICAEVVRGGGEVGGGALLVNAVRGLLEDVRGHADALHVVAGRNTG
ncbi:hypothetical protein EWM64_g8155 [Hericium alpestre]|uniref:Uncharacterized protein n=1 Tax=Hericium alpestre TaxID=135208 RepID=A0A4Y9ZQV9_9AGAM|nr:hypothetical protein EWM64_g8155 [Hericium alpestre]